MYVVIEKCQFSLKKKKKNFDRLILFIINVYDCFLKHVNFSHRCLGIASSNRLKLNFSRINKIVVIRTHIIQLSRVRTLIVTSFPDSTTISDITIVLKVFIFQYKFLEPCIIYYTKYPVYVSWFERSKDF